MSKHIFGGPWTEIKLDAVEYYLGCYTRALKQVDFDLWYIDAFAGSGDRENERTSNVEWHIGESRNSGEHMLTLVGIFMVVAAALLSNREQRKGAWLLAAAVIVLVIIADRILR